MVFFYDTYITCLLCISLLYYLYYRWDVLVLDMTTTAVSSHYLFPILSLVSETLILIIGCINMILLLIGTNYYRYHQAYRNPVSLCVISPLPVILIIIPTLNEDIYQVLEPTLNAVQNIDYPSDKLTIVIGDDGQRSELQEYLRSRYPSFFYHTRRHIYGHAKAGNLNDILMLQDEYPGEFVLVLDSDMIPERSILHSLLTPFYDYDPAVNASERTLYLNTNCAFVQSPQFFHNISGYDFLGQHYHFFYQIVLRAYQGFSMGVPCCGTNVLFRRSILEEIDGFQYGSITEDFNTSLRLHFLGYESKYIIHKTASGMSPLTLSDFYQQRRRWTIGGLQMVCQHMSLIRRLPFVYQWIYGFNSLSSFCSPFYLVLFISPLIDLWKPSWFPNSMNTSDYWSAFFPYMMIYISCFISLHSHMSMSVILHSMQETIYMIPFQFQYIFCFLAKMSRMSFQTTPKQNTQHSVTSTTFLYMFPFLCYEGVLIYSLSYHYQTILSKWTFGWLLCIGLQMFPPIGYGIQQFLFFQ